jgi:peptide/nickel transport system substrate-binding protein
MFRGRHATARIGLLTVMLLIVLACQTPKGYNNQTTESGSVSTGTNSTAVPVIRESLRPIPEGKAGGILRYAVAMKMSHYDLQQSTTYHNLNPQGPMYETLIRYNPLDGARSIVPGLAKGWEVSSDGKTYTFFLRGGVTFHDGTPLTSHDVKASWDRIVFPPPGVLSFRQYLFKDLITEVKVVDDLTVQFLLSEPRATFMKFVAIGWNVIYSKKSIDANDGDLRRCERCPGTGPFKFLSHTPGERIVLERYNSYWNKGLPYLDGIEMYHGSTTDRGAMLLTGKVDYARHIAPADLDLIEKLPNTKWTGVHYWNAYVYWFNMKRKPLDDPRIRKAMHMVIDKPGKTTAYSEFVYAPERAGWYPSTGVGGCCDRTQEELDRHLLWRSVDDHTIATAKALMVEAGYPSGIKGLTVIARGTAAADHLAPDKDVWERYLGIDVTIRGYDPSIYYDKAAEGNYDLTYGSWINYTDDPSDIWAKVLYPGASQNYSFYDNARVTALMREIDSESDPIARGKRITQMHNLLDEDPPFIVFSWHGVPDAWHQRVRGYPPEAPGGYLGGYLVVGQWDLVWIDDNARR